MDFVEALAELETNDDLHEARLLVLLDAFAGKDGQGEIEGLTKVAKLDFLLRYPALLEKALLVRHASIKALDVKPHERNSVESKMVRYRFGPWDHRYRRFLNLLMGKGLITIRFEGRTVNVGLTPKGKEKSAEVRSQPEFEDFARRARVLKSHLDLGATHLMRFVYSTFPELESLRMNEGISL